MKFQSSTGNSFELQIIGYQFPEITDGDYDANWMIIQVHVTNRDGTWTARDASMLTWEVSTLARWLKYRDQTYSRTQTCGFIEPNLEFRFSDDGDTLTIFFDLELRPDWIRDKYNFDGDVSVDFAIAELDLINSARELEQQLLQFPIRGNVARR